MVRSLIAAVEGREDGDGDDEGRRRMAQCVAAFGCKVERRCKRFEYARGVAGWCGCSEQLFAWCNW